MKKAIIGLLITMCMILGCACGNASQNAPENGSAAQEAPTETAQQAEKNGDVYILFTSDVHCGIDQGFGFVGLQQIRDKLEKDGYTTILADNGDMIQGEAIGAFTKGDTMVDLMNAMHYDVGVPGNHAFDFGMDQFFLLKEKAEFPLISCNFTNKEGELICAPYVILEAAEMKIAFVGVTTPTTITSSTPKYFQNEEGEYIYSFMQEDRSGEAVYQAVQNAVDAARAEGVDYVYVMGHTGNEAQYSPWTYADIISHTNGIDVYMDGHSHDTDYVVMKNKDGEEVTRMACGTKMEGICYSHISAEKGIVESGLWIWTNPTDVPEFLDIQNEMTDVIAQAKEHLQEQMVQVVGQSEYLLTINDPVEKDTAGKPIRMIRRAETNLGDFCADVVRAAGDSDIGLMSGGNIRVDIEKGDITYGKILEVFPFRNSLVVVEATGQQILDALEWGAKNVPNESGCFFQVSGLSYEVDVTIPSSCVADENGLQAGIEGPRRVKNVMVGNEPIDPAKTYTVSSIDYVLLQHGDGLTAFDGAKVLQDQTKMDTQSMIEYIQETLGGTIGEQYADPYGEGRITIIE